MTKPKAKSHHKRPFLGTTKIDNGAADILIDALRKGNYIGTACALAEISTSTLDRWRKRAEKALEGYSICEKDKPYVEFYKRFNKAGAEAESEALEVVQKGGTGWQAKAWFLERTKPDKYGRRDKADVRHTGKIEIKVGFDDEFED
jgi:hypothetical protein